MFKNLFIIFSVLLINNKIIANDSLLTIANNHLKAGEFINASNSYESIINTGNTNAKLFFNFGVCNYKTNNLGKALWSFNQASIYNPFNLSSFSNKTIVLNALFLKSNTSNLLHYIYTFLNFLNSNIIALLFFILIFFRTIQKLFKPNQKTVLLNYLSFIILIFGVIQFAFNYKYNFAYVINNVNDGKIEFHEGELVYIVSKSNNSNNEVIIQNNIGASGNVSSSNILEIYD